MQRGVLGIMALAAIAITMCAPLQARAATAPSGNITFMINGEPAERAAYDALIQAFSRKNHGIKVEAVYIPNAGMFQRRLVSDFAGDVPPDVFLLNSRRYAPFAQKGAIEPLDGYIARSKLVSTIDFYPQSLEPYRWNGKLMGIPQNISSLVVYYNKQLFDKAKRPYPSPNWTWDEFVATAKALTRDTNGDGVTDEYGLGTEASIFRVTPFIWGNGGDLVDDPKHPTRLALGEAPALEALTQFINLQVRDHVVPSREAEAARGSEGRFLDGTLAMFMNSRRGVPTYRAGARFDWDVAPLPVMKSPANILHSDGFFMSSASKHKPAAWAFIEFANSAEGQILLAKTGRTVPSRKAVAQSHAFLASNFRPRNSKVFLDVIPHLRAVPVMTTWGDIEGMVSGDLERAFHGDVSLEDAINTTTQRTKPFFAQQ